MAEGPGRVQEGSDPSQCDSACRMVQLRAAMIVDRRARLLLVTLGFLRLEGQLPPALLTLHRWLDTWRGIGHLAVGMARQGYDLQLARYDDRGGACNLLRKRHGALPDERDGDRLGADTVASGSAGRLGGAEQRWSPRGT